MMPVFIGVISRVGIPGAGEQGCLTSHCATLHMHAVDAIYTPTHYQLSTLPKEMHHKARVVFDGMDTNLFQRRPIPRPANFRGLTFGPDTRLVTFASHGLESARGSGENSRRVRLPTTLRTFS